MKQFLTTIITIVSLAGVALSEQKPDQKVLVLKDKSGAAILGYDAVAYFTDNKPAKGNPKYQSEYGGAKYYFASKEHKVLFDAKPVKYAPAYGGYCGYAASIDRLSPISPEWFQIINGKLVLQHNKKATDKFNADAKGNFQKANKNWPGLVVRNGSGGKSLVFTDKKGIALEGYDVISYFKDGKPAKGDPMIEATFDGALYHFVSQANRETFEKSPLKYIPAYGGFCGFAASIGKVRPANPLIWSIVDRKLIVQHTQGADELWKKDVKGNKSKADKYWPHLVAAKVGKKDPIDWRFGSSVLDLQKIK